MVDNRETFGESSDAVRFHLEICQSVIQRMAANSAASKGWCITLVSAILVLVADKSKPDYAFIAVVPTVLFFALDTYYLSLERRFRLSYNTFIQKLHDRKLSASDLYAIIPEGNGFRNFFGSMKSFSIWPFYGTLGAMIWIARLLVI